MIPNLYEREYGSKANTTIPCVLEGNHLSGGCDWQDASGQNSGLNSMPKGHKTLRLYDADEYLDAEVGDLVELPVAFADCADVCGKEFDDGVSMHDNTGPAGSIPPPSV